MRNIAEVTTAVANGDLSKKITVDVRGEIARAEEHDQHDGRPALARSPTRSRASRARSAPRASSAARRTSKGVSGTWKDLTDNVNYAGGQPDRPGAQHRRRHDRRREAATSRRRSPSTRAARSLQLKDTINTMVDQLSVVRRRGHARRARGRHRRHARRPGRGRGRQRHVEDLTDNVNGMASNLTSQVRNIADVTTAVANGDLSKKITVDVRGEIAELKDTINTMVDQLRAFAAEVTRVAREVGTEGTPRRPGARRGRQRHVEGPDRQRELHGVEPHRRRCATSPQVTTAVANGDLSQKITVDVRGEIARAQEHDQHDGRPALVVRRRGHARRARGRHRRQARRPGERARASAGRGRTSPTT